MAGIPSTVDSAPNGGAYCNSAWAQNYPVSYDINNPKQGSLISWTNGSEAGHVAVVEKVNNDGSILISEMYVKLGQYGQSAPDILWPLSGEEVRAKRKYNCREYEGASGCFQTRTLTKQQIYSSGWGGNYAFKCYIYLLDK